jgi:hypothetical protein
MIEDHDMYSNNNEISNMDLNSYTNENVNTLISHLNASNLSTPNISKKKLKKLSNNPMYNQMISGNNLFGGSSIDSSIPVKDRLKNRLLNMKNGRTSQSASNTENDKKKNIIKSKINKLKNEQYEKNEDIINNKVNDVINTADLSKVKKYKNKMKELNKKYGQILFDNYIKNLEIINDKNVDKKSDSYNKSLNIVNLYLTQNKDISEKTLNFSDDDN